MDELLAVVELVAAPPAVLLQAAKVSARHAVAGMTIFHPLAGRRFSVARRER
ncbi:hypothetical protein M6B22_06595 [Jatrophihabitans cynanchi]|uniref:Uncharacterized protein n=1 Tax=Jatrophihabitans cynanchi TaxID=2944128 RepID=A0ABY7K183_9ACTN|nr:hypothetical protein [Jatrophihabitans sp. SB3-54]WAX58429.1 hypothetical protein M6B22_06595 [Jatrophihabitans sp. SB3-54]